MVVAGGGRVKGEMALGWEALDRVPGQRRRAPGLGGSYTRLLFVGAGMTGAAVIGHLAWPWAVRAYRKWVTPRTAARTPAT